MIKYYRTMDHQIHEISEPMEGTWISLIHPTAAELAKIATEYKEGKITLCDPEEYLDRLVNFICYVRKDMVIERLFSRVPKEDASFSNWGISWWKLKDRFDEIMETNDYMQGCKFDYLNGAALRRWEI